MIFIASIISSAACLVIFIQNKICILIEWEIIYILGKNLEFLLIIDLYSLTFFFSVILISARVLTFSYSYIEPDQFNTRFHIILLSFVFSIVILIFRPNLFRVLIGWDGLGIRSYLLVIYYSRRKSFKAGIITALTNRLGDALLIVYISIIFYLRTLSPSIIRMLETTPILVLRIVFLVAARTKRAQIPFRAWLPAAIAAPTPVSALVHSSTLVTAGVYLLFRFNHVFSTTLPASYLLWVGGLTILLASVSAFSEIDIKKIVALSTLSQLGVIVLALGRNLINLGFLHLLAHAFFKALLFLSTGSIIHACIRYQDIRARGRVIEVMPISSRIIIICMFRLIGIPFIVRFYSKEAIIESIVLINLRFVPWGFILVGVLITGVYSIRILYLVAINTFLYNPLHVKADSDRFTNMRILILLIPGASGGVLLNWIFLKSESIILSSIGEKIIIYLFLSVSIVILFAVKNLNYTGNKRAQWIWTNMWNLPIFSGLIPLNIIRFRGIKLNFLVDYSWTYRIFSVYITETGRNLIYQGLIYNPKSFSRLVGVSLVFILLIYIM